MKERQNPRIRIYLRNLWRHKSKWLRIPFCDFVISELLRLWKLIARRHVVVRIGPSSGDVRCVFERFAVLSQISSSSSYAVLTDNFDFNQIVIHFIRQKSSLSWNSPRICVRKKTSDDRSVDIKKGDKRNIGQNASRVPLLYANLIAKRWTSTELIIIWKNLKLAMHLDVETSVSVGRPSSVLGSVTDVQGKSSFQNVLVG